MNPEEGPIQAKDSSPTCSAMACRAPACSTKYRDKTNKQTMFKARSMKQLSDWRRILSIQGVSDFGSKDRICILHFKEGYIERERVSYESGGKVSRLPRKIPVLTYDAVPTIFSSQISTAGTQKKRNTGTQLEYAVKLDPETFAKQRELYEQKLLSDNAVTNDDVTSTEHIKTENLFESVSDLIRNRKRVSPDLDSLWIANILDGKCIRWSLWTGNRSGVEKSITLYENSTVEVFVEGKRILLPHMDKVTVISDLQNIMHDVSLMLPCKKAEFESTGAGNACLGFVVKNVIGRRRVWCAPCCKYRINLKKRISPQVKNRNLRNAGLSLHIQYNKLRRRNEHLKMKVKELKNNVLSLKTQYNASKENSLRSK